MWSPPEATFSVVYEELLDQKLFKMSDQLKTFVN